MSLFASKRERQLWLWTLVIVLAIYSTLGLASRWAATLGQYDFFGVGLFLLGCFLVLATVITQGLKVRPSGLEIAVALGITAVYILLFVRMAIPTERSHLVEYGVVAVFIYEALLERASQGRHVPAPWLLAIVAATLVGAVDELIQLFIPSRVFDPVDIFFNTLAAVTAVAATSALRWARQRRHHQPAKER